MFVTNYYSFCKLQCAKMYCRKLHCVFAFFSLVILITIYVQINETKNHFKIGSSFNSVRRSREYDTAAHDLWRPKSVLNTTGDRIFEQFKWTQWLANSSLIKSAKPKKILVFDGIENYYGTEGKLKCPFEASALESKCEIYEDKRGYGYEQMFEHYDGIVSLRHWEYKLYEPKVPASRLQFLYILECPYVAKYADLSRNDAILASYWRGSDVTLPYYKWQPFPYPKSMKFSSLQKNESRIAFNKTRLAAMIVSNCHAKNNRLKYVKELQKYIPVDIYGDCGPLKCKSGPQGNATDICLETIRKYYKFYLSFEKASCRDYITEKFYANALLNDAVPVVMGAPRQDYKFAAPPNSYIHIEDFQSPKHLAEYLLKLDRNYTLYQEYFKWKSKGRIISVWSSFFCRLCGMLFYADLKAPPFKWKDQSSWKSANKCLPLGKWYWNDN